MAKRSDVVHPIPRTIREVPRGPDIVATVGSRLSSGLSQATRRQAESKRSCTLAKRTDWCWMRVRGWWVGDEAEWASVGMQYLLGEREDGVVQGAWLISGWDGPLTDGIRYWLPIAERMRWRMRGIRRRLDRARPTTKYLPIIKGK